MLYYHAHANAHDAGLSENPFDRIEKLDNESATREPFTEDELKKIFEKANQVLKTIVEQKKLDLVVQEAAFVSPRVDITNEVIAALNSK